MNKVRKILIIGGSGFIGTHLCKSIQDKGYIPVVYDPVPPRLDNVEYFSGDMSTIVEHLPEILQDVEVIYHLGWSTRPASADRNPLNDLNDNVLEGVNFLDNLVQQKSVPKLIFSSSGGTVYGDVDVLPVSEDCQANPIGAYGAGKLTFEHYLKVYNRLHDLDYLVFRPSNPYGPGCHQGVISVFLKKILKGESIEIWGDGSAVRDYIFIDDLVGIFMKGIDYKAVKDEPRIFNAGSGIGTSLSELIKELEKITGRTADVSYLPEKNFGVREIVLDCSRVESMLCWKNNVSLDEGVKKTLEWLRKN